VAIRKLALLGLILVPISAAALAAASMVTVAQQGRAFSTGALEIARDNVVRFSNEDKFTHQIFVDSPSFKFESDEQPPGTTVDIAFSKSGTFEVRCHIHPKMLLHVDVR